MRQPLESFYSAIIRLKEGAQRSDWEENSEFSLYTENVLSSGDQAHVPV